MVRIHPAALVIDERAEAQVILLREEAGRRCLSFETGTSEGLAIEALLSGRPRPRPGTHELLLHTLTALGAMLTRVELKRLGAGLEATLLLQAGKERREVSARPSDGLALALLAGAPLFAEDDLLRDERDEAA